jgi:hypothetical protein
VEVQSGDVVTVPRGHMIYLTLVDGSGNVTPSAPIRVSEASPEASSSSSSVFSGSVLTAVIAGGAALVALIALVALVVVHRRRRHQRKDILAFAKSRSVHADTGEEADSSTHLTAGRAANAATISAASSRPEIVATQQLPRGMLREFETLVPVVANVSTSDTTGGVMVMTGPSMTGLTPMTHMAAIQHGYTVTEPAWSEHSVVDHDDEEDVEVYDGEGAPDVEPGAIRGTANADGEGWI